MAIKYHLDVYPANDPRDGTRLVRLSADNALQAADYRDVIGVGSGRFVLRATRAEAAFLDPAGEQYVRVVRDTGASEKVVGGFWTNQVKYEAAVTNETQRLEVGGAGVMAYLARSVLAPHIYIGNHPGFYSGNDPLDGVWALYEIGGASGDHLGSILWRVIVEAQLYRVGTTPYTHRHSDDGIIYTDIHDDDRRRTAIPDLVLGFDQFEDSSGNPWTLPQGGFSARTGDNLLEVVRRLMEAGLYVEMDPHTFELRAWENEDHRRNRTGGAWGTNVVRLQAPTDGTIATGNIKSNSERLITSHIRRTTIWTGSAGNERYGFADTSSGIPWEGYVQTNMTSPSALDNLADAQMAARDEAGDVVSARIKLGTTPASGKYLPWEHVKLDDLVTVHTGTDEWDFNEAEYPVGALRIHLRDGGDWDAWVDLGTSYEAMERRQFEVSAAPAHTHPPNPQLCRIGGAGGTPAVEASVTNGESGATNIHTGFVIPSGLTNSYLIVGVAWRGSGWSTSDVVTDVTWKADFTSGVTYPWQPLTFLGRVVGNTTTMELWGLANPTASVGSNGQLSATTGTLSDRSVMGGVVLSGVNASPVVGSGSGTSGASSASVASQPGARVVNFGSIIANSNLTAALGLTELSEVNWGSSGSFGNISMAVGTEVAAGPETSGWTHASVAWTCMSAAFGGGQTGDLPQPLALAGQASVGTASRAARCDHRHEHGDLSAGTAPNHSVASINGLAEELANLADRSLHSLNDVDTTGVADGDVIVYDAATSTWVVAAPSGGGGGMTNPMTTAGDVIVGGSSGTPQRLGIGSAGQVLTVSSGAPAWATPSGGGGSGLDPYDGEYRFTSGTAVDFSAATASGLTASDVSGYLKMLTATGTNDYWDAPVSYGTGDFDVAARVIFATQSIEISGVHGTPTLQFYVSDSARSARPTILFEGTTESTTRHNSVQALTAALAASSDLMYGFMLPIIFRIKRVGTALTYYVMPANQEVTSTWTQLRGITNSTDIARVGFRFSAINTESKLLIGWCRNL